MWEEKEQELPALTAALRDEEWSLLAEVGETGFLERDFCINIDEMELEFVGPIPRLTGRIEINLEAPSS